MCYTNTQQHNNTMVKEIRLTKVPEELYWEWKKDKENGKYKNWTEYFKEETSREDQK